MLLSFLLKALDEIEIRETRLLIWGIVDGYFRKDELVGILEPLMNQAPYGIYSEDELIEILVSKGFLVKVENIYSDPVYRSRMAETVRLLQRLRQLFPKHNKPGGWQEASTLVADYRFQRRRRQYPKRDVSNASALQLIKQVTNNSAMIQAVQAIISPDQQEMKMAGFQVRVATRILEGLEKRNIRGTIICAGTGSGKTLAFYLPALASIIRHQIVTNPKPWVKTVALYPRTELLKDQLREVLQRSIKLRSQFNQPDSLSIRIGVLYGDTPESAQWCKDKWQKRGEDFICPSLQCLQCNSEFLWLQEDHSVNRERLVCKNPRCQFTLDGTVFPLTRSALKKSPPDILLTTTEMLNQRMSDHALCHLFGIGTGAIRPPELVLLDEVHTYEGRHGAQVAYLMRRWQSLVRQHLNFVGLSATLMDAQSFFVSLTGLKFNQVQEIKPLSAELESEGAEYMIALRGDPVSKTALLSTTIQTAMLLQRCLDSKIAPLSEGTFGKRTFVFTDKLDVINRLYFDLMSAEGLNNKGQPDFRKQNGGLAVLRSGGTSVSRYLNGQDWQFCEKLGHKLSNRLVIERVSSQDRGIDFNADIVIATAALEVGFDDPTVGAVIQHKAPKGFASFLQRKGRAGRSRGMRPWMAIVLSDYGRDRLAYQNYDQLFDPELPTRTLPLSNRYILRMQAVFSLMDYLSQSVPGNIWQALVGPGKPPVDALIKAIQMILESETATQNFMKYLQKSLEISEEEASFLLWEYPRPIMTSVLPTALRRLKTRWLCHGLAESDFQIRNNPLPEFIPGALFSDLNVAEVQIQLPGNRVEEPQVMPIFSALKEFAPGSVSRRFGIQYEAGHWLDLKHLHSGELNLDIDHIGTHTPLGEYQLRRGDSIISIPVFRPILIKTSVPPQEVVDSSHGQLLWHHQFIPLGQPCQLESPKDSTWSALIPAIQFFTHSRQAALEVRRFTTGSDAEISLSQHGNKREKLQCHILFERSSQPVALGTCFPADGVLFQLKIPDGLYSLTNSPSKWRALRTARFMDMAWRGATLSEIPSPFMREWLSQVYLSSLTYESIKNNCSLEESRKIMMQDSASLPLSEVLERLFQSKLVNENPDELDYLGGSDFLREEIDRHLKTASIISQLHEMSKVLYEPLSAEWEPWLRSVYQCTMAAVVLKSISDLCPTLDPDDLCVDLDRGVTSTDSLNRSNLVEIWITEKNPGGNGLIEQFMRSYAEDPRRFFSLMRSSLEIGEFELIDHQLLKLLTVLNDFDQDSKVRFLIQKFRNAQNFEEMLHTTGDLRHAFVKEGFSPFHGFLASVGNRILRPGMGEALDQFMFQQMKLWHSQEDRLGVEIDLRVFSYWMSQSPDLDEVLIGIGEPANQTVAWKINTVSGLLWARGRMLRQNALELYNPFVELPVIERLLVIDTLKEDRILIQVNQVDWLDRTTQGLASGRLVTLTCPETNRYQLGEALDQLITHPIESGYLKAYARLQGIRHSGERFEADIELLEALQ
ncbi:MAG: DEAD/DEAH box helicase [SAR324 cluster bacterium]|nr:DEAD/DEAH box helicase [SAR324 cluster bacterium]